MPFSSPTWAHQFRFVRISFSMSQSFPSKTVRKKNCASRSPCVHDTRSKYAAHNALQCVVKLMGETDDVSTSRAQTRMKTTESARHTRMNSAVLQRNVNQADDRHTRKRENWKHKMPYVHGHRDVRRLTKRFPDSSSSYVQRKFPDTAFGWRSKLLRAPNSAAAAAAAAATAASCAVLLSFKINGRRAKQPAKKVQRKIDK